MSVSHSFVALRAAPDAVVAACSCGWVSAYAHAFEKYARLDWHFHIDTDVMGGDDGVASDLCA